MKRFGDGDDDRSFYGNDVFERLSTMLADKTVQGRLVRIFRRTLTLGSCKLIFQRQLSPGKDIDVAFVGGPVDPFQRPKDLRFIRHKASYRSVMKKAAAKLMAVAKGNVRNSVGPTLPGKPAAPTAARTLGRLCVRIFGDVFNRQRIIPRAAGRQTRSQCRQPIYSGFQAPSDRTIIDSQGDSKTSIPAPSLLYDLSPPGYSSPRDRPVPNLANLNDGYTAETKDAAAVSRKVLTKIHPSNDMSIDHPKDR